MEELNHQYRPNEPAVVFDQAGGEYVLINLLTGHYFRLDKESSELWAQLSPSFSSQTLLQDCDNAEDLRPELVEIIEKLENLGLITRTDSPQKIEEKKTWTFKGFKIEIFTDLEDILGLDPIHEVDSEQGWPIKPES
jgi:hypothetical protein